MTCVFAARLRVLFVEHQLKLVEDPLLLDDLLLAGNLARGVLSLRRWWKLLILFVFSMHFC